MLFRSAGHAPDATTYTQTVVPAPTVTTLASSAPVSAVYGALVTLSVAVDATTGTPTGTVTIREGATVVGSCTLSSGRCDVTTATLATGDHDLVATYATDGNFAASASATLTQTIVANGTTTTLTAIPSASSFGQTVRFQIGRAHV